MTTMSLVQLLVATSKLASRALQNCLGEIARCTAVLFISNLTDDFLQSTKSLRLHPQNFPVRSRLHQRHHR
jgi:hypothetical protein